MIVRVSIDFLLDTGYPMLVAPKIKFAIKAALTVLVLAFVARHVARTWRDLTDRGEGPRAAFRRFGGRGPPGPDGARAGPGIPGRGLALGLPSTGRARERAVAERGAGCPPQVLDRAAGRGPGLVGPGLVPAGPEPG